MSKLEVDKITPQSGTTLTIGDSGDTIVIDSTSVSGAKLAAPTLVGSASSAGSILFKEDTDNGTNAVTLIGPAATADVTLTLPAANDTVVGRQTTDTLTNKTINASQLVDASIATGKLADDAVTYAKMQDTSTANRVIGAASAGVVGEVQVATDMVADNAITLAKMASGTDGNIISYDASGNPVAIATGNDGQVLTSTGAGSPPAFETPSGVSLSGSTNNTVATVTGANALVGESNLLFSGNDLTVGVADNGKVKGTYSLILESPSGEDLKFNTGGANERMRINPAGNVILGSTSQVNASKLSLKYANTANDGLGLEQTNNDTLGYAVIFKNTNGIVGTITNQSSGTAFNTSSDYRLKENVDYTFDATTRLKQLKPARFNFIVDDTNTLVDGFIAHEVSDIVPEAISGEKDATETKEKVVVNTKGNVIAENIEQDDWQNGKITDEDGNTQYPTDSTWEATKVVPIHQGIDQSKLVPLLVKTIQELEARITQLENN